MISWRPWLHGPINGRWVAPVALAIAFIFAFPQINDEHWYWPLIAPREASAWLPWISVIAMIAGVLSALMWQPRWMVAIVFYLLSAIACWMIVKFKITNGSWSGGFGALMILLFALVSTVWWVALEQATEDWPILGALMMGFSCACTAMALLLTGSLTYGKFALIV